MSIIVKPNCNGGKKTSSFPPPHANIIESSSRDQKVLIKWEDPDDVIVGDTLLSKWKGTKLFRKIGSMPYSMEDPNAILIVDNTIKNKYKDVYFEDTGLINDTEYYYRLFTYDENNIYETIYPQTDQYTSYVILRPMAFDTVFSNNTWEEISMASVNGNIPSTWKIGDEIEVPFSLNINAEPITMQIWDFNHFNKADGSGKAGLVLGCKDLPSVSTYMNGSGINAGGWDSSALRSFCSKTIYPALPESLRLVIKEVITTTGIGGGNNNTIKESIDKVFVPSVGEIGETNFLPYDGPKFPIFTDNNSRRRSHLPGYTGAVYSDYWTRSPSQIDQESALAVWRSGTITACVVIDSFAVCFCFCI